MLCTKVLLIPISDYFLQAINKGHCGRNTLNKSNKSHYLSSYFITAKVAFIFIFISFLLKHLMKTDLFSQSLPLE